MSTWFQMPPDGSRFNLRACKFQKIFLGEHIRWPRGIMGFTRAFRNLQGKFSTAIATFNFQPRFNFSLFQLPQRNRYFQRSTAVPTFNRDSVFQRSSAIPTFNRDSVFQRSSAIPTFNHDSVFQLSSVNATFNCDWNS